VHGRTWKIEYNAPTIFFISKQPINSQLKLSLEYQKLRLQATRREDHFCKDHFYVGSFSLSQARRGGSLVVFLIFRGAYPHWAEAFVPTRHINV
jgi:hypothetical protein